VPWIRGEQGEWDEAVPTTPIANGILKDLGAHHVRAGQVKSYAGGVYRQRVLRPAGTCCAPKVADAAKTATVCWLRQIRFLGSADVIRDKQPVSVQVYGFSPELKGEAFCVDGPGHGAALIAIS
jgi:hypothetical protein